MAHKLTIHNGVVRFVDNERTGAAWHKLLGHCLDNQDAVQAYALTGGDILQTNMPLYVQGREKSVRLPGWQALIGIVPGHHDGGEIVNGHTLYTYGCVTNTYVPLFHKDTALTIAQATDHTPVDTMGLLHPDGSTLFCSIALSSLDIRGDEVANYLNIVSTVDGKTAVRAKTASVRMVCYNTMTLSLGEKTDHEFRGVHHKGVGQKLQDWLAGIWQLRRDTLAVLKEAYTVLASTPCTQTTLMGGVLSTVYPMPERPESPKLLESWEQAALKMQAHRSTIATLFDASPTRSAATTGTLWGAYQAVCEYEDYARPRAKTLSKFVGVGAERKERAFSACMALV